MAFPHLCLRDKRELIGAISPLFRQGENSGNPRMRSHISVRRDTTKYRQDVHVGYFLRFLREWLDLPSWQGKATVRSRRQGRRGMAFTGAKRKPLTEDADGSGAEFGQEGHETGLEQVWMSALRAALGPAK